MGDGYAYSTRLLRIELVAALFTDFAINYTSKQPNLSAQKLHLN